MNLMQLILALPAPEEMIRYGGIALICAVVFIETGLLLGLILPGGDSFLFTTGLLCATGVLKTEVYLIVPLLILAGVSGDLLGYSIGKKMGKSLFHRPDSWIFKRQHLEQAEQFYRRKGKSAIILGKFLPVVRTFNPLLSGVTRLRLPTFLPISLIGSTLWISTLVLSGYFVGMRFPGLKNYIQYLVPAIILVSLLPVLVKYLRHRREIKA